MVGKKKKERIRKSIGKICDLKSGMKKCIGKLCLMYYVCIYIYCIIGTLHFPVFHYAM